jgi:chromosome segregation ATPase
MSKHASEGDFAELALAVYVEELVTQKRVLFVGDPSSPAPERLASSARSVDVVSTRSRVRGTRRGGRVNARRWPGAEDEGRWDVVLVPDLAGAGLGEPGKVAELARWVAPGGVVVAGTPDRAEGQAALGYEELFDLLDATFDHVRMLGQAPFVGFSVVDFAPPGELEVTFDGSILEGAGESAQRYYALCGDRDVVLDAYAVVQVPSRALAEAEAGARVRDEHRASELAARLREQQDALDAVNVHAEEIERELEAARGELDRARHEIGRARDEVGAVERERASLEQRVRALESELAALAQAQDAGQEYAALESALYERGRELNELRLEVERRGTLVRDLVEELRELERAGVTPLAVAPTAPPPAVPGPDVRGELKALHAQLDRAVARAVDAEAQKAELGFRLDEVRGELAMAERRFAQELEEMRRLEAALRGTVRGLNARLGEVIELHQLTQARLALAEDDRAAAEARNRRLVRELAEAREQLELEIARGQVTDAARSEAPVDEASAAREGRLMGALARAREQAAELEAWQAEARKELGQARAALQELDERVQSMRSGYEARVAELVDELHRATAQAEQALAEVGALRARAESHDASEAGLRGELTGLRLRLADRESAIEALRAATRPVSEAPAPSVATVPGETFDVGADVPRAPDTSIQLQDLRGQLDALRGELDLLAAARRDSEDAVEAARAAAEVARAERDAAQGRAAELTVALEAAERAAQAAVAQPDPEQEQALARLSDERDELARRVQDRDAVVARLEQELSERGAASAELEARLQELSARLLDREAEVSRLEGELSERGSAPSELEARVHELSAALAEREASVSQLRQELSERGSADSDARVQELSARVADGEAVVARLERELAQAAGRSSELEQRLEETAAQLARAREDLETARAAAAVDVEDTHRELDDVRDRLDQARDRLEQTESERDRALGALQDARAILQQLVGDLPRRDGASGGESVAFKQLRDRVARLDAEAADREVLLRSLTAQLEERDDRIRGLERLVGGGESSDDARVLQQKVLEMEERVARLQEELEHERSRRRLDLPS